MDELDLPDDVAVAAWRCVQEALTNVVRHANARQVLVSLRAEPGTLRVVVQDDGVGFDPGQATQRLGLAGLRERAAVIDGKATIRAAPGQGCRVELRLPIPIPETPP